MPSCVQIKKLHIDLHSVQHALLCDIVALRRHRRGRAIAAAHSEGILIYFYTLILSSQALYDLGMSYPYFIKEKQQFSRILMSLLLFANFTHYFSCMVSYAVYASFVEKLVGWKRLWLIGLFAGSGGTLFSCSIYSSPHVDGSSVPSAYIGVLFGYMLIKWDQWSFSGSGKWQMLGWLLLGSVIVGWEAYYWELVDLAAAFASFMIGVLCSFVFIATLDGRKQDWNQSEYKCTSTTAIVLVLTYYVGVVFYFFHNVEPQLLQ